MNEKMKRFLPEIQNILGDMPVHSIQHNTEGLVNEVFIVNDSVVVRFAKDERARKVLQIEQQILTRVRTHLPLQVPEPFYASEDAVAYMLLPGEALTNRILHSLPPASRRAVAGQLGDFLAALHDSSLEDTIPPSPAPIRREAWLTIRTALEEKVYPLLLPHQVEWADQILNSALQQPDFFDQLPVLIHGDLAPYHILFNREEMRIQAVIDFGAAGRGDPALDLGTLMQVYGAAFTMQIIQSYPEAEAYLPRARFYAQSIELQWVLNGVKSGQAFWFTAHLGGARDLYNNAQDSRDE